jgi:hypothetical protein
VWQSEHAVVADQQVMTAINGESSLRA